MTFIARLHLKKQDLVQFLEYFISGTSYFWTGYATFALCYSAFGWNWLPAKMLADLVGWTVNYVLQRYWVFNNPKLAKKEGVTAGKYALITALNLALDYAIIWTLNNMSISPYIGFFISAGFFTVWNYAWYRFWVFYVHKGGGAKEVI